MTDAMKLSDMFGNDGTNWTSSDGRTLADVADEMHALFERKGDLNRHIFPDGSAVVVSEGGWDIEGDTPFSWKG